jgi:hypothetical protein
MKHHSIENHIDNSILSKISDGLSLDEVLVVVLNNIKKFSERNCYMDVSKNYLLKNWKSIDIKRKYTTYYVIWSIKRSNDLDWLIKNKDRFPNLDNKKLFKLLKFKERLLSSTF